MYVYVYFVIWRMSYKEVKNIHMSAKLCKTTEILIPCYRSWFCVHLFKNRISQNSLYYVITGLIWTEEGFAWGLEVW